MSGVFDRFAVLDALPHGVCLLRDDCSVRYWNGVLEAWTGIERSSILGRSLFDVFPPLAATQFAQRLQIALTSGQPAVFSGALHGQLVPSTLPDGEPRLQHATAQGFDDPAGGKKRLLLLSIEDVTEAVRRAEAYRTMRDRALAELRDREWAEAERLASEVRYRTLFEQNLAGALRCDLAGVILEANSACALILGFGSAAELVGARPFDGLVEPESSEPLLEQLRRAGELADLELTLALPSGESAVVLLNLSVVTEPGGAAVIAGTMVDLSERKQLELKLLESQKLEAVGRLAGGIAHDFNNLLGVILGYCELLLINPPPPEVLTSRLREIQKAGNRAAELTRQLLAFARKQRLQPRLVELDAAVQAVASLLRRVLGEHIRVSTELSVPGNQVMVDPGYLQQTIVDLALNARDAMPQGGQLTLRTAPFKRPGEEGEEPGNCSFLRLSVIDDGEGIAADVLPRIFEPFFTTKPHGQGTGLGLSTAHGVIRQSGGFLSVESEPGKGASFLLDLPLAVAETALTAPPEVKRPRGRTVLVVEDQSDLRSYIRQLLDSSGFRVLEAGDGVEALQHLDPTVQRVDMLLSDVVMPRMGGVELAQRAAALQPDICVLLMSGYAEGGPGSPDPAALEPYRLISKPFTAGELWRELEGVFGGGQA